ncbi:MAG: hypoxanthine phosphoribosyltransferase [Bacteroidales bacterium]|nr:hypoxanthine phosphoribosyltransferase [Bacteroidales bacterium]
MKIKDRHFKPYIPQDELQAIAVRLGEEVSRDYAGLDLVVCPVLTGAFMFASDLLKHIAVPCEVNFVRYASYSGLASTGTVRCLLPFPKEVEGRDVLIVEDVVDSGLSMRHILRDVQTLHPRSVRVCSLFFKPDAFQGGYRVDYIGRNIGNEFIVGYGLDYDELGRNLKEIYVLDQQ